MATGPFKGLDKMTKNTKIVAIFAVFFALLVGMIPANIAWAGPALANTAFRLNLHVPQRVPIPSATKSLEDYRRSPKYCFNFQFNIHANTLTLANGAPQTPVKRLQLAYRLRQISNTELNF